MEITTPNLKNNIHKALNDEALQQALTHVRANFIGKRAKAVEALPEFDALRDNARDIKNHVLENLDLYLESFEKKVTALGGHVHWAVTSRDARQEVLKICQKHHAKTVTKSKSMISEEIELNDFLQKNDIQPIETDLGEYIIQLRGEPPSHIIAPAVHVNMNQVRDEFRRVHTHLPDDRPMDEPQSLLSEARGVLRDRFLAADVGITGANFLIAETGSTVIVTNEGNGDLTQTLPKVHIVVASIEKIVPTLNDMSQIMRVLARSATGQEMSVYTTLASGPKREGDPDGPEEYHVILLDNGRSNLVGTEQEDMLRCIRCGACMNHCPVYHAIGGHAYGWVYPGPIGSVLTPAIIGLEKGATLPNASSFCGRCEEVCPMRIPLPRMMRYWRTEEFSVYLGQKSEQRAVRIWGSIVQQPRLFHPLQSMAARILAIMGGRKKRITKLPFGGAWTRYRDMPAPEGKTFMSMWKKHQKQQNRGS